MRYMKPIDTITPLKPRNTYNNITKRMEKLLLVA